MSIKNYVIYDSDDAHELLKLNLSNNSLIYPLTPNAYSIIKKSNINAEIFNPITFNTDKIQHNLIDKLKIFNKNFNTLNLKKDKYYNYIILQLFNTLVPIAYYLYYFLPKNGIWFFITNKHWRNFEDFDSFYFSFLEKISDLHQIPKLDSNFNIVQNLILKIIFKIKLFFLKRKKIILFTGYRYGLKNLSNNIHKYKTNKFITISLIRSNRFPIIKSLLNLIKIIINHNNVEIQNPSYSKSISENIKFDAYKYFENDKYIKQIALAYSDSINIYINNFYDLIYDFSVVLKKLNIQKVVTDQLRSGAPLALGIAAENNKNDIILISHGSHSYNKNFKSNFANLINADGVLFSPLKVTTVAQSPIAEEFILKNNIQNKYYNFSPIMWGYQKLNKRNNNVRYIMHAGSYKILSQRPFMYETSNEYLNNILKIVKIVSEIENLKLIIRFRPKKELSLETLKNYLPNHNSYEISMNNSITHDLNRTSILISFSSTLIEECLKLNIPVIQFGETKRYIHIDKNINNIISNTDYKNLKSVIISTLKNINKTKDNSFLKNLIWNGNNMKINSFISKILND